MNKFFAHFKISLYLKKIDDVEICSPDRFFPNFINSANECVFINWPFLDAKYGEYIYVFFSCGVGKFEIWRKSTKNQNEEKETLQNLCVFFWKGCGTIWQKQPFGTFQNCLLFRSAIYQLNWMIFYLLALFFSFLC